MKQFSTPQCVRPHADSAVRVFARSLVAARGRSGLRLRAVLFAGALFLSLPAAAQPATNRTAAAELVPQLQARLGEAKAELGRVLAGGTNLPPTATAPETTEYRLNVESLVRTCEQHLDETARLEAARQRLHDRETAAPQSLDGASASILQVDELRDTVETLTARTRAAETTREVLEKLQEGSAAARKQSDERLRHLTEQMEAAQDTDRAARLGWQRTLEQTRNRLTTANGALNETRRAANEAELAEQRLALAAARRQLALIGQKPRFSQTDLDQVLANLETERRQLEAELAAAEDGNKARQQALAAAREELRQSLQRFAEAGGPSGPGARLPELQAAVELRSAQSEAGAQRVIVLRQLLDVNLNERSLWQTRFDTYNADEVEEFQSAYQRLEQLNGIVVAARPHYVQQIRLAASLIAGQRSRLQNRPEGEAGLPPAPELIESYRERLESAQRALSGLEKLERLVARWRESLDQNRLSLPLTERVQDLFSGFSSFVAKLWRFELFTAEDTITVEGQSVTGRRSITVGKVTIAVLILSVGYWLTILFARMLERLAVRRLKIEPNQAMLLRRWTRFALTIALVLFSLVSVKIPLTVFAFLGGALAIGVGFGTQNLLKNFISGIIILFERPFRVGDVLDVDNRQGTVTVIGIRSSVLQLFDGTEVLIPNSVLLENNLTNWTYSSGQVRFGLTVGVAYGSDSRKVAQLLAEVAGRHELVLKDPAPLVLFKDFGESTLAFELRYWVNVQKCNSAIVASDLRHLIASAFAAQGISIAFPQRDLHFAGAPLQVRMLPPDQGPPA